MNTDQASALLQYSEDMQGVLHQQLGVSQFEVHVLKGCFFLLLFLCVALASALRRKLKT